MPLDDFYKKIAVVQDFDIKKEIVEIINENGKMLSDMLKMQLRIGEDGDGNEVTLKRRNGTFPFYSDRTVFEKEKFGQGLGKQTGWITHYMTGEFYNSIYVYAYSDEFIFDSDVPYFNDIIAKSGSGNKIMELNKDNLLKFSEKVLKPQLQKRFNQRFNS